MKIKNEYDSTKNMLNKIRSIINENKKVSNILIEQEEKNDSKLLDDDSEEKTIDGVNIKLLSKDGLGTFKFEKNKEILLNLINSLRSEINPMITLEPGFMFDKDSARLIGNYKDVVFMYSVGENTENGLYIKCDTTFINDEFNELLKKLTDKTETVITILSDIIESRR
jgi:hypothetical protein